MGIAEPICASQTLQLTLLLQVVVAIRPLRRACPGASQPFALFTWSGLYAVVAVTFIFQLGHAHACASPLILHGTLCSVQHNSLFWM